MSDWLVGWEVFGKKLVENAAGVLTPASLSKFRKAMARYEAGLGDVTIVDVGDSTSAGRDISVTANTQIPSAPASKLASILMRSGYEASANEWWGRRQIATTDDLTDFRLSRSGGWGHSGGLWFCNAAGTLGHTPTESVDTWDIYYVRSGAGGTFSVNIGGGSALATVSTGGSSAVLSTTVSGPLSTSQLNIAWSSGSFFIVGVVGRRSTKKRIRCINFGISGGVTADLNDATNPWSRRNVVANVIVPDLAIINLGINNWRNSIPLSTFTSEYSAIVDAYLAVSSVAVRIPFFDSVVSGLSTQQQSYVDAIRSIARTRGLPIIDMRSRWVSYEAANALGYYCDTVHATATGYADVAVEYRNFIRRAA